MTHLFSIPDLERAMPTVVLGDGKEYQITPMNGIQSATSRALGQRMREVQREAGDDDDLAILPEDLLQALAELAADCLRDAPREVVDALVPRYHLAIIETASKPIEEVTALAKNGDGAVVEDPRPPSNPAIPTAPSSSPSPATADAASGT